MAAVSPFWYRALNYSDLIRVKDWSHEPIYDRKLSSPTFKPEDESCPGILTQAARTGTETDVSLPERGCIFGWDIPK